MRSDVPHRVAARDAAWAAGESVQRAGVAGSRTLHGCRPADGRCPEASKLTLLYYADIVVENESLLKEVLEVILADGQVGHKLQCL